MLIYLDTRDQIALVETLSARDRNLFTDWLFRENHKFVFSLHNIIECCAMINQPRRKPSVIRTLYHLQSMPHTYIAESKIQPLELQAAITAFGLEEEYKNPSPFVRRFDDVVSPYVEPATRAYLKYDLWEIVNDLSRVNPEIFASYRAEAKRLRSLQQADRNRSDFKRHDVNFKNTIDRHLRLYKIEFSNSVPDLAEWIWTSPIRCPAIRLGYEMYHKILGNVTDRGEDSDIADFAHLDCIPYVDLVTLDRRMRAYVNQIDKSIGTDYNAKVRSCISDMGVIGGKL